MNKAIPLALVIEDDDKLSEIFSLALKAAMYDVQAVKDGKKACSLLSTVSPVLIVLDLHLPNVSGDKILKYIREQSHLVNTKVILATADPQMADILRESSELVLIKPVSFSQLRDLALRLNS
ncbi:MAG: response regulator [Anaerolineales bacterium]|nr:response regulator [Anaerolineales bacterium]